METQPNPGSRRTTRRADKYRQQSGVAPSAELNFEIWDTLGCANGFQPKAMEQYSTYLDQVLYVRKFIKNRQKWIDENL